MINSERLIRWNQWYDQAPADTRFQYVLWPLLLLGAINIWLTVSTGFPFALLVVLGILCLTVIRLPYSLGWISAHHSADANAEPRTVRITGFDWVIDLNHRYEAMPEGRRFWVIPAVLLIAGAINMLLTIGHHFPFGLLFLLALLALVAIRAPYVAGWLEPSGNVGQVGGPGNNYLSGSGGESMAAIGSDVPPPTTRATEHEIVTNNKPEDDAHPA